MLFETGSQLVYSAILRLLNTLSSSWHFCVYFLQAQAFRCIPMASLTLDVHKTIFGKGQKIS